MTTFFIVAAVLLLIVVALMVYPLIRGRESAAEDRTGEIVGLSRERLDELKQQKQSGEISESEYTERVSDLEAQLSDDLHAPGASGTGPGRGGGRWVGIAAAVFIPVLSGLLYLTLGQPKAVSIDTGAPAKRVAAGDAAANHPDEINSMVSRLAARLERNPNDPQGWLMLGRSYVFLDRHQEAFQAFSRARALIGDDPELLVKTADALAMARDGRLTGKPRELVNLALQQKPNQPQALWMEATAAHQAAEYERAITYYRRVKPLLAGEARQHVEQMIQQLTDKGFGQPVAMKSTTHDEPESNASLTVDVLLAPAMRDAVEKEDTVFVFATAVNGPSMPLAVVRKNAADLPFTVTLDDSQSMTPQLKLSKFDTVTVGARISRTGQPTAQPGDLEGSLSPVSPGSGQTIAVTINKKIN